MAISNNFKCNKCGNETYLESENEYEKVIICEKCAECYVIEQKKMKQTNIPKCPTCSSADIQKIGTGERVVTVAMLGIFSKKINKSFKCKHCGYTW